MKKRFLTSVLFLTMGSLVLTSCSSDNNDTTPTEPSATGKYVLLTAESTTANAGYYAAYDNLPTGAVDNIGGYSLQARAYGGFRHYKNWIFNKATLSGETGVVRFSLNASGILEQSGFIKCGTSAQNLVVDETTGFYFDADRGKTKIQKFNPTTMQRTGEIDLSELVEKGSGITTNVTTGDQTIIAKEGKLYVNISYSPEGGSSFNQNMRNLTLAVIDIATGKPEKTIVHSFVKNQGHARSEYPAYTQAPDGTIYMVTTGWDYNSSGVMEPQPSTIFRIKAGQTDFDQNWSLKATDLGMPEGAQLWSLKVYKGKLFVDVSEKKVELPSYSNLLDIMYRFYAVDIESKSAVHITGLPLTTFGFTIGNLEIIDDNLFIRIINKTEGFNGYYKLNPDGVTASQAFSISRGGEAKGFVRLSGN
ncbi:MULTISPECIES: hypothetical protein [Flavobacterium]|uniref:hypothetical protein n=1 Tax=Flavobacterium TaxID=237 RepID=UPI00118281AD|nr:MULTISPECIES: hypothetical protein [Flavobacterium]MCR4033796.1 hypothetical protein [Flavobacterium panacis]